MEQAFDTNHGLYDSSRGLLIHQNQQTKFIQLDMPPRKPSLWVM